MNIAFLIGRIIFGGYWLMASFNHFKNLNYMHSFWKLDDAQMKQIDMINFTKNMALVGALLMFLLLPHPWPMSLGIG